MRLLETHETGPQSLVCKRCGASSSSAERLRWNHVLLINKGFKIVGETVTGCSMCPASRLCIAKLWSCTGWGDIALVASVALLRGCTLRAQ